MNLLARHRRKAAKRFAIEILAVHINRRNLMIVIRRIIVNSLRRIAAGSIGYLAIQSCEDGWNYTIYHSDYSVMDGGQLDAPELTIQEAREQILEAHHMEKGRRLLQDYDAVMDKVAETEELSADHRPSTLEKLAELASDTSAPKSSARSAPEL